MDMVMKKRKDTLLCLRKRQKSRLRGKRIETKMLEKRLAALEMRAEGKQNKEIILESVKKLKELFNRF